MDNGFWTRFAVTVAMFTVALIALYTFDGIPFKIIYALFALIAIVELFSFIKRKFSLSRFFFLSLELLFIILSIVLITKIDVSHFWYIILGVPGYDISAYVFGKLLGTRIFKKSRPFPRISKNKTWEGTALGLVFSISAVAILIAVRGTFDTDWLFLFCGPLALIGDLYESFLKRQFSVKDSGEIVTKNKFMNIFEMLIGGHDGHGGYLDRIDSTAFTASIMLLLALTIG